MSGFWERFDAVCTAAKATAVGERMTAEGYHPAHTGGGCMVWEKVLPSGDYLWICDEGNGLGDSLTEPYLVGYYGSDGHEWESGDTVASLEAAIAWCAERKSIPPTA